MNFFKFSFICILLIPAVLAVQQTGQNGAINEYGPEDQDKIIGLKHFEAFLSDLEKAIAKWTRDFRETVVWKPDEQHKKRFRRQAAPVDPDQPPRRFTDWIVVQDLIEGANYVRKQISDFIDRATRFITGDQFARQAFTGPYVPIVKELREYLVLLQRRLNAWSVELERVFRGATTEAPILLAGKKH